MIEKWLSKNEAAIVDRDGKSDIWKLFGQLNVKRKWLVTFSLQGMQEGFQAHRWNSIA